jgi:hypothetical protein
MLLSRRQIALRRNPMPRNLPDLKLLEDVAAPRILQALRVAAAWLEEVRVPFALAGGLAVGAHGHPRATRGVDFLVGDEAFEAHEGGLVTIARPVPVQVGDVPVDAISIRPEEGHLRDALARAKPSDGIPVLPLPALVYLKLRSRRRQDAADVVALLRVAADPGEVRSYVAANAPELLADLDALAAEAAEHE